MSSDHKLIPLSPQSREIDRPLLAAVNSSYGYSSAQTSEQMQLRDILHVIRKHKWLILVVVLIVTLLTALYMCSLPSIYEAETTLRIEKNKSILETKDGVLGTIADPSFLNTQIKLLENPELWRQVIFALNLQNNPAFVGSGQEGFFARVAKTLNLKRGRKDAAVIDSPASTDLNLNPVDEQQLTPEQLRALDAYENVIKANLAIEPIIGTHLVTVRFRHTDPTIAMRVVDTIAKVFIYNDAQRENSGSQNTAHELAKQIADLQLTIKQQEETRINYMKNRDLPLGEAKGQNLTATRLETISSQWLETENERRKLQAAYEEARNAQDIFSIPEVQASADVQKDRQSLAELQDKRAQLIVRYTAEWPEVKKIDEQIKQTTQRMNNDARAVIAGMKARLDAAVKRQNDLLAEYTRERSSANEQSQSGIMLSSLNQEIEANKQLYNTLIQRQREVQINSSSRSDNIMIVTPSRLPLAPVGPPRVRNILIAFLIALFAGIGLAFLLEFLDDSVKSLDEVDRYLHLPALGLIPYDRALATRSAAKARSLNEANGANGNGTGLVLIDNKRSPLSEAYLHLRTGLLFSSAGRPPQSILVASAQPGEGKTTTAVNLAIALAQTGSEVVLVDCDLRRPSVYRKFGLPNGPGLTNYLSSGGDLDDFITAYPPLPNLKIITAGQVPPNPAELLSSTEARDLLAELSKRFKHIIIDSPPVISFTDAAILSTFVNGVILVVNCGQSSRAIVRRAKQKLGDVGAHLYGVVMNNMRGDAKDYYYYTEYYHGYHEAAEGLKVE